MGMNVASLSASRDPEALMDVNTTPLIDVMLVLLVMLIITIPTQLHSIGLTMGGATSPPALPPVVHTLAIDFDGSATWDGQPLPDAAAIDARMREVGQLAADDQPVVNIKPNQLVDYNAVAAAMASAQRNGVAKMGIIGHEQFVR